jgi:hypothetical protein
MKNKNQNYFKKSKSKDGNKKAKTHDDTEFLANPYDLMCQIFDDSEVKIMDFNIPFAKNYLAYDLSLMARGG